MNSVVFTFATGQMAAAVSSVLATLSSLPTQESARVIWLVDPLAEKEGWLKPCAKVLKQHGIVLEKKTISTRLTLDEAKRIVSAFPKADHFIFCAQGGRKIEAIVFLAALAAHGKTYEITYLENKPIQLLSITFNGNEEPQEKSVLPGQWAGLSVTEIVQCSGYSGELVEERISEDPRKIAGLQFEQEVKDAVDNWVTNNSHLQDYIAGVQTSILIKKESNLLTDWDVTVALKDGTVIVLECKRNRDLVNQLFDQVPIKDLQSRRLVLQFAGTNMARFLVVANLGKGTRVLPNGKKANYNHASTPELLEQTLGRLKGHFEQGTKTDWLTFYSGSTAEKSRKALGLPSFEEQLNKIIEPYVSTSTGNAATP